MFWNVFVEQCAIIGKSPNAVAKELNIPSGSITAWKNGATPRNKTLLRLSEYFNVPVLVLTCTENKKEKPSEDGEQMSEYDIAFSELWATFSDEQKKAAIDFMKMFKK